MTNEAKIENVRRFVRAYGELAGFVDRVDDLQHQILGAIRSASETAPTFESTGSILGRHLRQSEMVSRKAAWLSQHHLGTRAFCVGNQLLQFQGGNFLSAPVDQLKHLGYVPSRVPFSSFESAIGDRRWSRRVDAVLIQPDLAKITVVKAVSVDQVRTRLDRGLSSPEPSLWEPSPKQVFQKFASSKALHGLVFAEWVLRSAYPDFDVRAVLAVVDPRPCSWRHEAYDITGTALQSVHEPAHDLCKYDVCWEGSEADERFGSVPDFPTACALNSLPIDRATRTRMILDHMWRKQASSEGLAPMTAGEISRAVRGSHLVHYTPDWRRHDIEDCLVAGGFIERPQYEKKCYVLTALGVFESIVSKHQLLPPSKVMHAGDVMSRALSAVRNQSRLLARYAEGEQVIVEQERPRQ